MEKVKSRKEYLENDKEKSSPTHTFQHQISPIAITIVAIAKTFFFFFLSFFSSLVCLFFLPLFFLAPPLSLFRCSLFIIYCTRSLKLGCLLKEGLCSLLFPRLCRRCCLLNLNAKYRVGRKTEREIHSIIPGEVHRQLLAYYSIDRQVG